MNSNKNEYDVVIIGAGPAGMACAIEASKEGANILLLDEQSGPGGQIYRSVEQARRRGKEFYSQMGKDYFSGEKLVKEFRQSEAEYIPKASVWNIDTDAKTIFYSLNGRSFSVRGRQIVIANGAMERAVMIPGWTLPGVMSAGGAQVLLKSSTLAPEGRVILAGSGPLLLLAAIQLLHTGVKPTAVVMSTRLSSALHTLALFLLGMLAPEYFLKGIQFFRELKRHRVPVYFGAQGMAAQGDGEFSEFRFQHKGKVKLIEGDLLLLHEGVTPNTQLTRLCGVEHRWVESQAYWKVVRDRWGRTNVDKLLVVGDGGYIAGAKAAELDGRVCGIGILNELGFVSVRESRRKALLFSLLLMRQRAPRPYLNRLFAPSDEILLPQNESTLVCRCSEVTVKDVHEAIDNGCDSPNQVKAVCRSGMGPCQGRLCGLTIAMMVACKLNRDIESAEYYKIRAPIKPLSLGELASLTATETC